MESGRADGGTGSYRRGHERAAGTPAPPFSSAKRVSVYRKRAATGSRHQRRARDGERVLVVPLAGREGLVDLLERVRVGEDPLPRPAGLGAHEEVQRAWDDPRVVLEHAHDLLRAPDEEGRLQLYLGAAADGADLDVGAAGAQHLDPLRDD